MKYILYIFLFVILFSCNSIKVVNVSYVKKLPKNYFLYMLPRNIISIDIELTEIKTINGPYYKFAEKFLGIKNVPQSNSIEYFISNADLKVLSEPDSNNLYFVIPSCKKQIKSISLTNTGIITSINSDNTEKYDNERANNLVNNYIPFQSETFTELSQKDFIKIKIDTIWKQVKIDTNFVRIPVQKKTIDTLSFESKAKEAAHHILRLRKRLFKLLTGAYEKVPIMNSVSDVIKELKNEEEEYLSLFIGKTFTYKLNYRYYYTPDNKDYGKKVDLCFYSSTKGISNNNFTNNKPVVLEINNNGTLSRLDTTFNKFNKASNKKGFVYRIPEIVTASLIVGENILIEKQVSISQLGVLCNLPVNYINKKHFVQFNPTYGNIIKIGCK
ncbi:MAG: hypothetical protein COS14_02545 [Bacteroidetes bacterium CG02_land_8_20_14_3_00_31_25]|nr:DUF4831 family protein [Bacteroidota bacterium]PIV62204.1 MAG: hypothetical protein COS14_02545 [Bacteroidetes bacterium CG02_land_8_20_14_3_00_31_25]PIX35646.1 MAG: hypothetical protein COZ59_05305 [Bacteroidetes bacterium CG_4_8_14_3_um_filter_31_14]